MKNIIAALALVAVSGIAFAQAPTEAAKPATNEVAAPAPTAAATTTESTTVKKTAKTKKSKKAHKDQAEKM